MGEAEENALARWRGASLRDSFFSVVQSAGSQDISSEIVEDFRTALGMLARGAPAANPTLNVADGRDNRVDTVIVIDEDGASSSSSGTRHRLTPDGNAGASSLVEEEHNPTNDMVTSLNLQRELNRLRTLAQSSELQRFWVLLLNTLPFFIIVFFKAIIDGFFSLLSVVVAIFFFHVANNTFLASLREKRYFYLLQSFTSALFFVNFQMFFHGLDSIYIPMAFMSNLTKPVTFFATLQVVLVVDFSVKIITVILKAGKVTGMKYTLGSVEFRGGKLSALPMKCIGNRRLRRLFQWIEYSSQLYRYLLPIPQWTRYLSYTRISTPLTYFGDQFFVAVYVFYKACLVQFIGRRWFQSTRCIFRLTSVGSKVSSGDIDSLQCTICFNDFSNPIKLTCGHVFCEECIGTWLDNEHTCPMCRATVAQEDNMWKSGETTYSPQLC